MLAPAIDGVSQVLPSYDEIRLQHQVKLSKNMASKCTRIQEMDLISEKLKMNINRAWDYPFGHSLGDEHQPVLISVERQVCQTCHCQPDAQTRSDWIGN